MDTPLALLADVQDRTPTGARAAGVDLVIVRYGDAHSVLYGRCQHRGVLLADGHVDGENLICGVHGWDYRIDTGVSDYNPAECLHRFDSAVIDGRIMVRTAELAAYRTSRGGPPAGAPDEYAVHYASAHATPEEPFIGDIHELARNGLSRVGHHGPMAAMGVPRDR